MGQERSIRRRRVSSTVRIVFAGTPAIRVPAGNAAVSRTTAPLATTDPEPIRAPLLIVEFMPIKQSSPMEQPWTTAACPTVTRRPITAGMPRSTCTTALSWTFESRLTTIESIPAQDGAVPDARPFLDGHVSHKDRARGDIDHHVTRGSQGHSLRG